MVDKYIQSAKAVALSSEGVGKSRFRVGAVLVHRRQGIIAARCNSYKTHPFLTRFTKYPHLHAEAAVILAAGFDAAMESTIYVARVDRRGNLALAKPCEELCQPLMLETGVKRAIFTTSDGIDELRFY